MTKGNRSPSAGFKTPPPKRALSRDDSDDDNSISRSISRSSSSSDDDPFAMPAASAAAAKPTAKRASAANKNSRAKKASDEAAAGKKAAAKPAGKRAKAAAKPAGKRAADAADDDDDAPGADAAAAGAQAKKKEPKDPRAWCPRRLSRARNGEDVATFTLTAAEKQRHPTRAAAASAAAILGAADTRNPLTAGTVRVDYAYGVALSQERGALTYVLTWVDNPTTGAREKVEWQLCEMHSVVYDDNGRPESFIIRAIDSHTRLPIRFRNVGMGMALAEAEFIRVRTPPAG